MMFTLNDSYKTVMACEKIAPMVPHFVTNMDFREEPDYEKPFSETAGIESRLKGLNRLLSAAETGEWYYPLYSEEECREDPEKKEVNLVWLPSSVEGASERPYILIVPGGGYRNVWNISEGWPIAAEFNRLGLNAFVLTYRVNVSPSVPKALADYARALQFIREKADFFQVKWDRYYTTGFSAGANLILYWGTKNHGYGFFHLPKPLAMFPIYAPVSWSYMDLQGHGDDFCQMALGLTQKEAASQGWDIENNVPGFPPCYIAATAEDELVDPEHSRILYKALQKEGIPATLEIGPHGGHGFAEGLGMCMEGWMERAYAFAQGL